MESRTAATLTARDERFLQSFEAAEIPFGEWKHRTHLKAAVLCLRRFPLEAAVARMRSGIKALNEVHGTPDALDRGYHETMTVAWLRLMHFTLGENGSAGQAHALFPFRLEPLVVRIELVAEVVEARRLESPAQASALRGLHVWREDVIATRFKWGAEQAIHALVVRVSRLASRVELPMRDSYGGCKSWVELDTDVATEGARPVLGDAEFSRRLASLRSALASAAVEVGP
ncbi:MAG: DUF1802 family protein [Verrucomicrobia bacterium]|nr:DUF1802 family protein [Verrucomicrobiota bacterium]